MSITDKKKNIYIYTYININFLDRNVFKASSYSYDSLEFDKLGVFCFTCLEENRILYDKIKFV